nr:hypothetical transcript [Hymenolepis microstoma]
MEDDIPTADYQSCFQFTNHGAYFLPVVTTNHQPADLFDDNYQHLSSNCQKALNTRIPEASVQHISEREPEDALCCEERKEKTGEEEGNAALEFLWNCVHWRRPSLTSTHDICNECSIPLDIYKEVYEIFDERVHPLFSMSSHCRLDSHFSSNNYPYAELRFQHQILYFLNRLFASSLLTAESAIVSLMYLERLISSLEMHVVAWSWRRQLLACILIASKVLDDQAVWNADYCQFLKDVHVEDLNDLERHTLSLLQFNTGIPPAVYARYYFDLLTLGDVVALPFTDGDSLRRRRRLTPRLARRLRILPPTTSVEERGGLGNNGIIFDLPLSSISLSEEDLEEGQRAKRQRQCRRRRVYSASSLFPPTRILLLITILENVRQLAASGKSNSHRPHDRSRGAASGSEYEFSNYCPTGSSSSSSGTSSTSSDSSAWKSSGSSSTFSATSGYFQLPPAATAAVTAFDLWGLRSLLNHPPRSQLGLLLLDVRQLAASGKSNSHRPHDRSRGAASGSEYEFSNYCPTGSSSSSSGTSSTSSDSSAWKSSGSSSTFSATSGYFQLPPAATAAVTAFDLWGPCTSTGVTARNRRREDSNTFFLLQQDSGLY